MTNSLDIINKLLWIGSACDDDLIARTAFDAASALGASNGTALIEHIMAVQSEKFGDRQTRTAGVVAHIHKEADEARENPGDLVEWVDIILLAIDGFRRNGGKAEDLLPLLRSKIEIVAARTYPDPYETDDDVALEHDRSAQAQDVAASHEDKMRAAAITLLAGDETGSNRLLYDACEGRVKVYKFIGVLNQIAAAPAKQKGRPSDAPEKE